jgi:hypothetical protein
MDGAGWSPSSSSNSERRGRGNIGMGVSCSTIANEYLPNRRKWLDIEESKKNCSCSKILQGVTVGAGGGESVVHSGVNEDGHRGVRAYRV